MLSCPSIQDILMNHFQYPGQTRAKTMCHKCGWPYLGIQPTWCVRPSPPSHLQVRGIEYLSTVAVGRRKSTKPAPFILVPLYLDSLHPVNCEVLFFYPFQKQDVWIFRRRPIHEEVGWQRKGNPKRFAAPYSGFSWCLFIFNNKKGIHFKKNSANAARASGRVFQTLPR